ncbi:sugar-binding transcriptional regulator [Clostridium gasigenes]|uniref:Central glycolytic genes regulator n=1 Tax=Clostridium gasigenes TaxID=94869 RepID=A0A1H0UZJ5_9CLOT|nr:sugar-binding domain-containing protein [Clostridium gasigenes]MBB6624034.1 sugar-binding transcriptional regulator [Clostridium gasigenes]MBB6716501.1 sugar-binding transcriptional regulator [Clostridium gasigenes]MBU3088342.1 sugar-binding transcriptional regulator [Clostridium gasigenes]MBU3103301.1 sugar-binding transcriptional regulator [Clostridium gasigenes]MBU3108750.1 sugar-binding transcriptional regulator [Clostridium gasigenes]
MQEILSLQKKIVPELVEVLEKRYNVLRTISYNQPIGRRVLANRLNLGERIVRTEISFLKSQNLIEINTPGMTVTEEGQEVVDRLKDFIHELKGLSDIEESIRSFLGLKDVIIVPGDTNANPTILKELGKATANYVKTIIKNNDIIALTGGNTIKEFVEAFPKINNVSDILVVPARGGMGRKVESQANTLAASFAKKINASYKMLHIPENLSLEVLDTLLKEKEIKEVIDTIHKADILIYGIGNAIEMAEKRGTSLVETERLRSLGAIGEAFGCYFNKESKVVSENTSIGININQAKNISTHIAVAAGEHKVESILSTMMNNKNAVLVTDESAGRKILEFIKEQTK